MATEEQINELYIKYGNYGATAILVIKMIEKDSLIVDKKLIKELCVKYYEGCSIDIKDPNKKFKYDKGCVTSTLIGLIYNDHINFKSDIKLRQLVKTEPSKNYNYAKIALEILENQYDKKWPLELKHTQMWKLVEQKLGVNKTYNFQMEVLKALIKKGLIKSFV